MSKKVALVLLIAMAAVFPFVLILLPNISGSGYGRIVMNEPVTLPLMQTRTPEVLLVYFGYTGCVDICSPRLEALASWYGTLPEIVKQAAALLFLDLSMPPERSMPDQFVKAFSRVFEGRYLDRQERYAYVKAFNAYFARSLGYENEYDHTSHLYMLRRTDEGYALRYIYTTYPYETKLLNEDIERLMHE